MDEILEALQPLFKKAEKEGLWFYCPSQDVTFSPKELREMLSLGRFIWGPDNWRLVNPLDVLATLTQRKDALENDIYILKRRMKN